MVTLHDARGGDSTLRLTAAAAQALPGGGTAGRLSAERVVLILPGYGAAASRALAKRLAAAMPGVRVGSAAAQPHEPPQGPAELVARAEASAEGSRRRILVVEDEPELAQIIEAFLAADGGYEVVLAHTGKEALERCSEGEPALVVVDLELPDVDGRELVRELRERVRDLPAIACSGKRPESAAGAGFTRFFRKPFDMRALVAEVERLLHAQVLGLP